MAARETPNLEVPGSSPGFRWKLLFQNLSLGSSFYILLH
jgi:hypothetical protein